MSNESADIVHLEAAQALLRDHFLGWQCRLRQLSMRQGGGRPTSGMRPELSVDGDAAPLGHITVLINKTEPQDMTAQFRHIARRTHDPVERWESAVGAMQAAYYQHPKEFSDQITALFGPGSEAAARLGATGRCILAFEQYNQRYRIPCAARNLPETDPAYQATYWHNSLFNPDLRAGVVVIAFAPDWAHTSADPPPG